MIVQRINSYPAVGKETELRAVVEERVRTAPSRKVRAALLQQLLPSDGPVFVTAVLHDNLAAFEEFRSRNLADASTQAFVTKVATLSRQPLNVELFDVLVAPGGDNAGMKYLHVARVYPAAGQEMTMRAVLEELGKRRQAEGRSHFAVSRQVLPPAGAVFALRDMYRSLSEYEDILRNLPMSIQVAIARTGAISRASVSHEICEVLVPLPT